MQRYSRLCASLTLTLITVPALAADGEVDLAFGDLGTRFVEASVPDTLPQQAAALIEGGSHLYHVNLVERGPDYISRVTRLTADGDIDTSYGVDGHAEITGLEGFYDDWMLRGGDVDAEGRVYLYGDADLGPNSEFLACRLTAQGELDTAWGGNGTGCNTIGFDLIANGSDRPFTARLQSNGRLLLAGVAWSANSTPVMAVARFNAAGQADAGFGDAGTTTITFPGWNDAYALHLGIDPEGRIVVGGDVEEAAGNACDADIALARLLPDGSLDTDDFGTDGKRTLFWDLGPTVDNCTYWWDRIAGLAVREDSSIVVVGGAQFDDNTDYKVVAARVMPDGLLDTNFGTNGKVDLFVCDVCSGSYITRGTLQSDGKLVIVGSTSGNFMPNDGFVRRLMPDGSVDSDFNGGVVYFDYPNDQGDSYEYPFGLVLQSGRPVIASLAQQNNPEINRLPVTRLENDHIFTHRGGDVTDE